MFYQIHNKFIAIRNSFCILLRAADAVLEIMIYIHLKFKINTFILDYQYILVECFYIIRRSFRINVLLFLFIFVASHLIFSPINRVGGGRSVTVDEESPECFFWFLPKRSIPKPDPHRKDIIQQESLRTDMLKELKNSNYTRYHIELINRSCGG